jgi:hypothetical protein
LTLLTWCSLASGFVNDLWHWLGGKKDKFDFSILDALCLIIAIPSTYIIKLVTFARPPKLGTLDRTFFGGKPSRDTSIIMMGLACCAGVIYSGFVTIKLAHGFVKGGAKGGLEAITPGTVIEIMSMLIDTFSIISDLAEPERDAGWTADLAMTCTGVKLGRLAISAFHMAAGGYGMKNEAVDKVKEIFDVLAALVVFGMDAACFVGDIMGDGDKAHATVSTVNTLFDTVASVGYFTANEFEDKEGTTALTALQVCQGAALGGVVMKVIDFRLQYKKL